MFKANHFILFFIIKLFFATVCVFIWISPFQNLNSFFNCSIDSFDSLRYNHDAYVIATGNGEFFGEVFKNSFSVILGGILYKYFLLHPWIITLFNTLVSTVSTWILYNSLKDIMTNRRVKEIFFLSQFIPTVIIYEAILGKEVFYMAGYKLIFAISAYLFFSKKGIQWNKIMLLFILVLIISLIRPILLPGIIIAISSYFIKPNFFIPLVIFCGTLAMLIFFVPDFESLKMINDSTPSSNPLMQYLRTFFITDSPIFNIVGGFFRFILYTIYPFPLVFPNIVSYLSLQSPEDKCSSILTMFDQISFWWQLMIFWLIYKTSKNYFSDYEFNAWKYYFFLSIYLLLFFSFTYTLIHARYRIFYFIMQFSMIFIFKGKRIKINT